MLRELRIENLLLIERAELRLGPGLNVLTGETGAGKTVLAHSLDLLMGGRARKGIVRPGAEEAWVEGVFDLPAEWADEPGLQPLLDRLPAGSTELILGRRVSAGGRTSAFLGGRAAAAADLRLATSRLIAFYGQHEHRRLTVGSVQTDTLDRSGGSEHTATRERYDRLWQQHRAVKAELAALGGDGSRERDLDLYRFELDEIEAAAPEPDEMERLQSERQLLQRAGELREAGGGAATRIRGDALGAGSGVIGELGTVHNELAGLRGVDPELDALDDRLESVILELDDLGLGLSERAAAVETDPERLAAVDERIELLMRLQHKHGGTLADVIAHAEWCRAEIGKLEGGAARERELREQLDRVATELTAAAGDLTASRRQAADKLAGRITEDLGELAMASAELTIELVPERDGPGPAGAESAEFMLAPNPGMAASPLRDTASGGELSRVMLALAATGAGEDGRTLVFDEIDAGIGGQTAAAVGDRLRGVADRHQVLAITHLPQVAARAAVHFSIEKDSGADPATARVERLAGDDLVAEIRRMMGAAEDNEIATRHAVELLAANH